MGLSSIPPWVAFPDVDPEIIGSLQGSIDYWWTWFWLPFWEAKSNKERTDYLIKNNASPEWKEFIELHNPN
jgi:hypothetical protein